MAAAHGSIVPVKGRVLSDVSSYVQKLGLSCEAPTLSVTQFIKLPLVIIPYSVFSPQGATAPSGLGAFSFWRLTDDRQATLCRTSLDE
jgi:hypothetical protein